VNAPNYGVEALTKAARAAAEAFIAALDEATGHFPNKAAAVYSEPGDEIEFDPLHDEPPFMPDPKASAPRAQQEMAWITYLGAIGRLNAEEGRGALSKEIADFARKAGYSGGNAVNGWNSRAGSPRAIEKVGDERFLNNAALDGIKKDAAKLGIKIVGEISTVPQSKKP
jgi:hypothetical protein